MLGIDRGHAHPTELISAVLAAPVDLLWNGGIGTYVKASTETQRRRRRPGERRRARRRDRACAAAVVAEGGNLGLTQRGRVEFALARRPHQHRRHRQLGRRRLLRPRGEHQDPARRRRGRRRPHRQAAQRAAACDDRRGRRAGAGGQPGPERGARHRPGPGGARWSTCTPATSRPSSTTAASTASSRRSRRTSSSTERQAAGVGLTTPELPCCSPTRRWTWSSEMPGVRPPRRPVRSSRRSSGTSRRRCGERFADRIRANTGCAAQIIATVLVNEMVNRAGTPSSFRMAQETGAPRPTRAGPPGGRHRCSTWPASGRR